MTDDDILFSTAAKCFAPVAEDVWRDLTSGSNWADVLDIARRLLQDDATMGAAHTPARGVRFFCPLQDFLSGGEVDALFAPPSWEEKQRFTALHFTGGLPDSAMPVESLYREAAGAFRPIGGGAKQAKLTGSYGGESARYMRSLTARMGLAIPFGLEAYPDHLSVELDMMAVLLRSGRLHEAWTFLGERFSWLSAYRIRLIGLSSDATASFYVGLVDVLLGIWSRHSAERDDCARQVQRNEALMCR